MRRLFISSALIGFLAACNKTQPPAQPPPPAPKPAAAPASGPAPEAAAAGLSGKVVEKLDASPYAYLKIATANGEVWAAVPETTSGVGADVVIENPQPMRGFESKTLNRTFDVVYFGTLAGAGGGAPNPATQPAAAASQPAGGDTKVGAQHSMGGPPVVNTKIAKAAGADGKSIAEIFEKSAELKDKKVSINGQVAKFVGGVMGRNWVHIQDGTGSAEKGTHDLTVTTQGETKVGDVVNIQGTVKTGVDFGMGYSYSVLIDDAKISAP